MVVATVGPEMFAQNYADVFKGDSRWAKIESPEGESYAWDADSTYIKNPPYFDGMTMEVGAIEDLHGARVLGLFGDYITTDHISPAGNIKTDRSEEHHSALQSLMRIPYAVFCLHKKNIQKHTPHRN